MICRICREPWDLDAIHEVISEQHGDEVDALREQFGGREETWKYTNPFQAEYERRFFNPMVAKFRKEGCRAFGWGASDCVPDESTSQRSAVLSAIHDLMGDDADGFESSVEDAIQLGLL